MAAEEAGAAQEASAAGDAGASEEGVAAEDAAPDADMTQAFVRAGLLKPGEGIRPNGPAAAAMLAAVVGLLSMAVGHVLATALQPFEAALLAAGRVFFPGGDTTGGYSGKELVALVVWLGGWALLHRRLRQRQVGLTGVTAMVLLALLAATLLVWPPITRAIAGLAH